MTIDPGGEMVTPFPGTIGQLPRNVPDTISRPRLGALKAVAHKLARAGYHLLRDGGKFDVHRAFS